MSNSSLYSLTNNVSVSSNNFTTLYNTTTGNVVSANVPGQNLTTLYTQQNSVYATSGYGNANVEAFLNQGTDGPNVVGNINMNGNLVANGNISGTYVLGNGYYLTGISAGNSANANYANFAGNAFSVNVANVVGIGNIATVNLNGNGSTYLAGNGIFVAIGNGANANFANYAGNVTVSNQPNITSVGTLPNLNVGNVTITGNVTGNLIPNSNAYNLGNSTNQWQELYLSGNSIYLGPQTISSNANGVSITNNLYANYFVGSGNNLSNIQYSNVTGLGNVATLNLNGSSTQVLYGNGVFANVGNGANSNFANYAGTLISASGNSIVYFDTDGNINFTANGVSLLRLSYSVANGGNAFFWNAPIHANNIFAIGNITSGNANLGNIATANYFIGDGSNLSNIQGTNVSGIVANANYASYSNRSNYASNLSNGGSSVYIPASNGNVYTFVNSYEILNVSSTGITVLGNLTSSNANLGNLASANYFVGSGNNLSNIQGSNVSGAVAYATTANSVAGANVSGAVAYATTANSVAVANVVGIGNIATINLNGNSTQVLYGNGVFANIANGATANFANYAGNVTVNAQPNITSVGTLTSLAVTGNISAGNISVTSLETTGNLTVNANIQTSNINISNVANFAPLSTNPTYQQGYVWYDSVNDSLSYYNSVANSEINIGQEVSILVYNQSGATIAAGSVCYISGTHSQQPQISLAQANSASTAGAIGINQLAIPNNSNGYLTILGAVTNLNTSSYTAGDTLYLSATTAGAFANTPPVINNGSSNVIVRVGFVTYAQPSQGKIFTSVRNVSVAGANVIGQVGNALVAGTVYTNAQPNITSVGTLASLSVTGNISSGNANLGNAVTASYFIGSGNNLSNIQGINVSGIVANANYSAYAGVVTTNAQPNITSVGTLSSLSITGNLTSGNANLGNAVVGNYFIGSGNNLSNIQGSNVSGAVGLATYATTANAVAGSNVSGQVSNALIAGTVYTNAQPNITSIGILSSLNVNGNANVGNLLVTSNGGIVAGYANINGYVTVAGNLTSGNANLGNVASANYFIGSGNNLSNIQYSNVSGLGNIATINLNGNSAQVLYGNGTFASAGSVANANYAAYAGNVTIGNQPNITSIGTLKALSILGNLATATGLDIESTDPNSVAIGVGMPGSTALGAGFRGISISTSNTSPNANALFASFDINGVIKAKIDVAGNITGNYYFGNGSQLTGITATSANFANFAGNVTVSSQPNITSVGTLTSLSVTGNITSGNASLGNAITGNYFIGSGNNLSNIQGSNISGQVSNALIAGTVYTNTQPNITSVGTLVSLSVTGNITSGNASLGNLVTSNFFSGSGNLLSNIQAGNITGIVANANYSAYSGIAASANAVAGGNVSGQVANALVAGTVYTNAQPNITSVGTLTSLSVTGNITSGNASLGNLATANYFSGNGSLLTGITSTATPGGANTQLQYNNNGTTGGISTVTWNGSNISLGAVTSVKITGGSANQVLSTDGTGNLSFVNQTGGGGSTTTDFTPSFLLGGM